MAATHRAPKQWCLTTRETITSFENWKQNLVYTLSLDVSFSTLIESTWLVTSKTSPNRGYTDDGDDIPQNSRKTAVQKKTTLEMMLGQIANYCPIISRNTIVKKSTSLASIWQTIRLHFGFQNTGGQVCDFVDIKLEPEEKPEDLYQRLVAFMEDNLLTKEGSIKHHDKSPEEDEELSPSLENLLVLTWLKLIHPDLPKLVKQRYGTELRTKTLGSIKPEISLALASLIDEVQKDSQVFRTKTSYKRIGQPSKKTCPLCREASRPYNHFMSTCRYLPEDDRKFMARARQVQDCGDEEEDDIEDDHPTTASRVQVRQSPYLDTFYKHFPVRITIDSGATGNMIRASTAKMLGVPVTKAHQNVQQADGSSSLKIIGETRFTLEFRNHEFDMECLVADNLDVEVLAGTPFMECNDVAVRPAKHLITLHDGSSYRYGSSHGNAKHSARRAKVLRASCNTTVWPGDYIELDVVSEEIDGSAEMYAIDPRDNKWPHPDALKCIAGKVRIVNDTNIPQVIKKNAHIGFAHPMLSTVNYNSQSDENRKPIQVDNPSSYIRTDPDGILTDTMKSKFKELALKYDNVFGPSKGYNGAYGPIKAVVNMGPVQPPQRKGRIPQYSRNRLVELQHKFDELELMGVFQKPEDIGITAEYVNPSFLVDKPSGGTRLVTAFAEVGRYAKPQPSLMPDVNSTLLQVGQWKYIIASDLSSAFYQIPLDRASQKYCGVCTPFKGIRVYARSAMGMPGSETALEELMCRVLGDLVEEGVVAKIADDLYCGGNDLNELLRTWERVLQALNKADLRLSPVKTVIVPKSTTILGWIWSQGTISASNHRVSTLATCATPTNVRGLRSFIGAYKVLSRVLKNCAIYLSPLEKCIAGKESTDKLDMSEELLLSFKDAQGALKNNKAIVLPTTHDQLWIVTDGSFGGIGATMYCVRNGKLCLAGFFSAKLRERQATWLPCEIEALAIASAIKHFSPYLIQSQHNACVLTDSKPCVQAYGKLCRGEFSASPRVSTFLSAVSRYQASVKHIAGINNLPSDHASRNAPECNDSSCQVCVFVKTLEECSARNISLTDIENGKIRLPFTSRNAWKSIQSDCQDLRRTHSHLVQGTRPSKKATNVRDIKRYLQVCTIAKDGVLVVKRSEPLAPQRECIVVPSQVVHGLVCALHIQLCHPSAYQMKKLLKRYLFALNFDSIIDECCQSCHTCCALIHTPKVLQQQSSSDPPEAVGVSFAADVLVRERQKILVLRESVTSFTSTRIIQDERHETLRDNLICLCVELRPLDGPLAVIRTDNAPCFKALRDDAILKQHGIQIELGQCKNPNKNPVAERAVQEFEDELLKHNLPGIITERELAVVTARLNSRIRSRGISAREMLFQRDQHTNEQIPLSDRDMIEIQHAQRTSNHPFSEASKCPSRRPLSESTVAVGDIVYVYGDRDKVKGRDRYLVTSVEGDWCNIKKFAGNQLRTTSYRVRRTECFKVPLYQTKIKVPLPHTDEKEGIDEYVCENSDEGTSESSLRHDSDPSLSVDSSPRSIRGSDSLALPACSDGHPLEEKSASPMVLDTCYEEPDTVTHDDITEMDNSLIDETVDVLDSQSQRTVRQGTRH